MRLIFCFISTKDSDVAALLSVQMSHFLTHSAQTGKADAVELFSFLNSSSMHYAQTERFQSFSFQPNITIMFIVL